MDFTWLFLQMLLALVVVCAAAVLILRYWVPRFARGWRGQKGGAIELKERVGIAPGTALYLVRVGKRHFVLGGGEGGVSVVTEMKTEEK